MQDGIIKLDSTEGKELGFTSDKFHGYLWKKDNTITISLIEAVNEGKGYFKKLINTILRKGYRVEIPTPLGRMKYIVKKNGYTQQMVKDKDTNDCVEIWSLENE